MNYEKKKEGKGDSEGDENEVAVALVAECQVGDKKYKAGDTWADDGDECKMNICNPGGVISFLQCPRFDTDDNDESYVRIPGDNKFVYPHCCDYVFQVNKKKQTPVAASASA